MELYSTFIIDYAKFLFGLTCSVLFLFWGMAGKPGGGGWRCKTTIFRINWFNIYWLLCCLSLSMDLYSFFKGATPISTSELSFQRFVIDFYIKKTRDLLLPLCSHSIYGYLNVLPPVRTLMPSSNWQHFTVLLTLSLFIRPPIFKVVTSAIIDGFILNTDLLRGKYF